MIKNTIVIFVIVLVFAASEPYKTFYKPTYKAVDLLEDSSVSRVDLSHQNSEDIIKQVSQLVAVRSLNLSGITVVSIDTLLKRLPNPEHLRVLILDSTSLKALPKSIKRFKQLKQLSLNSNPNLHLAESIATIQTLPIVFLNLQHNKLERLPENIALLEALEDINLSNNHISDAESLKYLSGLSKLKSVWLNNNKLKTLPETIGLLTQLKRLYLEHNLLVDLPTCMSKMKHLQVLHLSYNQFHVLPEPLIAMPSLLLLHINHCNISYISEAFTNKAPNFKGLIIDHNSLSEGDKIRWKQEFRHFFLVSM